MLFMRADRVVRLYAPSTGRAPQSLPCAKGGGTAFGRDGGRDADAPHPRCLSVGEGLCPSRGRGRTPPLRPSTDGLHVIRAGRCGHRPLHSVCRWRVRVYSGRTESSAPTLRLPGVRPPKPPLCKGRCQRVALTEGLSKCRKGSQLYHRPASAAMLAKRLSDRIIDIFADSPKIPHDLIIRYP